jgi:hypothetical protein
MRIYKLLRGHKDWEENPKNPSFQKEDEKRYPAKKWVMHRYTIYNADGTTSYFDAPRQLEDHEHANQDVDVSPAPNSREGCTAVQHERVGDSGLPAPVTSRHRAGNPSLDSGGTLT